MDQNYLDFKNTLSILTPKVKNNITEVTPESLGQSFLLHIDQKTPRVFIPQMPRRAANSEDNTVPRITVSDTLLGCIIGYSGLDYDFHTSAKNGCFINALEFEYAVKPTVKLVYDADITNEHWLITYNKNTVTYKPKTIGKMFITKLTYEREGSGESKPPNLNKLAEIALEIEDDISIRIHGDVTVSKGYYKFMLDMTTWNTDVLKIKKLSIAEYISLKQTHAAMLSRDPIFTQW